MAAKAAEAGVENAPCVLDPSWIGNLSQRAPHPPAPRQISGIGKPGGISAKGDR